MKITPKFEHVSGSFETKEVKMICVPRHQHGTIDLCIKEPDSHWNYPVAQIQLHSSDLFVDFCETYNDAVKLGEEIARRWNECANKL